MKWQHILASYIWNWPTFLITPSVTHKMGWAKEHERNRCSWPLQMADKHYIICLLPPSFHFWRVLSNKQRHNNTYLSVSLAADPMKMIGLSVCLFLILCRSTQIKTYSWDNAQVVLAGNKCDMEEERVVSVDSGRLLAEQLGRLYNNILSHRYFKLLGNTMKELHTNCMHHPAEVYVRLELSHILPCYYDKP